MAAGDHNFSQILSDWNWEVGVEAFDHVSHHVKFSVSNPLQETRCNYLVQGVLPKTLQIFAETQRKSDKNKFLFVRLTSFQKYFSPIWHCKLWEIISWLLREITKRFFFEDWWLFFYEDSKVWYEIFNRITETVRCIICPENHKEIVLELYGLIARFMDWYFKNLNCKILP